jgi:enediyne biosynthesis protein E4
MSRKREAMSIHCHSTGAPLVSCKGVHALLLLTAFSAIELPFVLHNHPTPQKHLVETMAGGLAVFDYNGDGRPDIFFTNGAAVPSLRKTAPGDSNRLYRNDGGMKFTDVTETAGLAGEGYAIGASAADYDNDGDVDLFVAGVFRNALYRNKGDGTFEEVTAKAGISGRVWSVGGAWLDFDNDGLLDLFVVNYLQWTPSFDRFCGDQPKGIRVYCHPRLFEGLPNTLYRNRGNGAFEDVSDRTGISKHIGRGMSATIADADGDGFTDIFVTNDKLPNFLFRNIGGQRFEETALLAGVALPNDGKPISAMGADFRDYDNDGRPDISVTALSTETFPLFRNTGKGEFADATHTTRMAQLSIKYSGWSNGFYDFDNDGWKDLYTANSHVNDRIEAFEASVYRQPDTLFLNRKGQFEVQPFGPPKAWRGGGVADFDGDGRLDLVTSALGEHATLWRNEMQSGHWLMVRLRGRKSNRDGIGAVVKLSGQTNHMTSAVGYASSSHAGVHFGLGSLTRTDVSIRWPSGITQTLKDVPANQVLEVTEP